MHPTQVQCLFCLFCCEAGQKGKRTKLLATIATIRSNAKDLYVMILAGIVSLQTSKCSSFF